MILVKSVGRKQGSSLDYAPLVNQEGVAIHSERSVSFQVVKMKGLESRGGNSSVSSISIRGNQDEIY